jgi:hypothetical protein
MNLAVEERALARDPEAPRIFTSPHLNRSVILKHTLRANERELFSGRRRRVATKIVFPMDYRDLKLGGMSIFLGQKDFERDPGQLARITGAAGDDMAILAVLDTLPSLDPFLVKECCARHGLQIPPERLTLSPADQAAMEDFVHVEMRRLITCALPSVTPAVAEKFSRKILTNKADDSMRPLMETLRMTEDEFRDWMFSWRGFLYYKWRLETMTLYLDELFAVIRTYQPKGGMEKDLANYIAAARPRVAKKLAEAVSCAGGTIANYNDAFETMVAGAAATKFLRFLLEGPKLFVDLGEQVGMLDHYTSLWRFRRIDSKGGMTPVQFAEFLIDLDGSLSAAMVTEKAEAARAAG